MDGAGENLYEFSGFRLDTRERTLRRDGGIVPLQPKTIDVLCVLVSRAGEVVTKAELMEAVWPDSFVEESNLTQSIYTLRRTLGADENGGQFIETLARRGYRFVAEVTSPQSGPVPEPSRPPRRFRWSGALIAAVLAIVILLPVGIYTAYRWNSSKKNSLSESPIEKVDLQRLTFSGNITFPVIAPDGNSFLFSTNEGLFLQDVGSGNSIRLDVQNHKVFGNMQFTPDGQQIYFRDEPRPDRGGDLYRVSRLGGAAQKIIENAWSTPGFSPDGKQAAFIRFFPEKSQFDLVIRELETSAERVLLSRTQPAILMRINFPAWSPDGKNILVIEQAPAPKRVNQILVVNVASGIAQALATPKFSLVEQTVWHPENGDIYVAAREGNRFFQLWRVSYPSGEAKRLTNDLNIYRYISLSADGRSLMARQGTSYAHLWTATADSPQDMKQLTSGNLNRDGNDGLLWTPNGDIIYSSRIMATIDLWKIKPSDGSKHALTEKSSGNTNPSLSHDGKHVYFTSTRNGGTLHLWRMGVNGEDQVQLLSGNEERNYWPCASPDGQWIYYIQKGPSGNIISRRSTADDRVEAVTEAGKISPDNSLDISPDGRFLAFGSTAAKEGAGDEAGTLRFGILPTDGSGAVRFIDLKATVAKIFWSPDGKSIDYIQEAPEGAQVWRRALEGDPEPRLLFTAPKDQIFDLAWSKDGKNLAVSRGRQIFDAVLLRNFE